LDLRERRLRRGTFTKTLNSRCGHFQPRMAWRFGAAHASCDRCLLPLRAEAALVRVEAHRCLLGGDEPNRRIADAPCRSERSESANQPSATAARTFSTMDPPRSRAYQARSAFHRWGAWAARPTPEGVCRTAHVACIQRLCRPRLHARHVFTHLRALDPPAVQLFASADAPDAAHRLLQQNQSTNTPTDIPDLEPCDSDESESDRATALLRGATD
jgi:hypothetical protein